MKWRRNGVRAAAGAGLLAACLSGRAELARWIQLLPAPNRLQAVFFRTVALPDGPVSIRRPPKETRAELTKLLGAAPADADLYALRAREDEEQLDFAAAASDWKKRVELAADKTAAALDLADFYHRRLEPREEIAALERIGQAPSPAAERSTAVSEQISWKAFQRILGVISDQLLPADLAVAAYRNWMARYPGEPAIQKQFINFLADRKQWSEAERSVAGYRAAFPADTAYPVEASATLAWKRGALDEAVRIYDGSFRPLWPPELVKSYFDLLKQAHGLRRYLEQARARARAAPADLDAAARIFYYYQQQGDLAAAQRALIEFKARKQARNAPWSAAELFTLGQLFEGAYNYDQAARSFYALYSAPGAIAADRERALANIARLLLAAPEQPIQFGSGDLTLYRDIAQADPYPGFLNGILSLLLNSTEPRSQYADENAASVAYFHRAKAAETIALFDAQFPASPERPGLHAPLIEAYAAYGDNEGVIRAGQAFLAAFPKAPQRTRVALAMADAYARKEQTREEFAIYDDLLKELAADAGGVPVGAAQPMREAPAPGGREAAIASPAEYARVLDRYISRLVSMKRVRDALALYRREIDRNPNDPGLYERLAAFLEQNNLSGEVARTYRQAMAQFPGASWSEKLARWYLRRKQTAQFDQLSRDVAKIFSGTELESYVVAATSGQQLSPALYRQVNLYAHERFPYDLAFVRNLLAAYTQKGTADGAAYSALLRQNWFYANDLRDRFFEQLASANRLDSQIGAWKAAGVDAPGAGQFVAEAEAWRSHFEAAAAPFETLAAEFPADAERNTRAASLLRSLAAYDPAASLKTARRAIEIEANLSRADPRDRQALTRIGEIYADRELYARAAPHWNRLAEIEPGRPDGYVEAAAVFWDYFRFDDALRLIAEGRRKLANPALFAYEAGAIYEGRRDDRRAIEEYARGGLEGGEENRARNRLVQLARRARDQALVDEATAQAAAGANPAATAVALRVDVLAAQNRRTDMQNFLRETTERAASLDLLLYLERLAAKHGFADAQGRAMERQIALIADPVERMREQIALARFYEGRRATAAAGNVLKGLYQERPAILGVIRAIVDFYWRNKEENAAIEVLTHSAGIARGGFKAQFTFEAARKAAEARQYGRARALLAELLQAEPFRSDYLAAMADALGREGDDRGLREFYARKLEELRAAALPESEKTEKAAALRRGLIPVLTRLNDYAGAVDQYIEIVKRFPEDEGLAREAAAYAAEHGRPQQIAGYFIQAAKDSPKDYRWPLALARVETQLEDYSAAIAAYAGASAIRPERVDLYVARAALDERLLRFEDAAQIYAKLYELNYHNSQWMDKLAEVRARQGQSGAAVQALRTAYIDGNPKKPDGFFAAAAKLESWGMLAEAREYAENGAMAAGKGLVTDYPGGAQIYARAMTRARRYAEAYRKLSALAPPGEEGLQASLREIGTAVSFYYTPEEKSAFAAFAAAALAKAGAGGAAALLPMADAAGLADLRAQWRYRALAAQPGEAPQQLQALQQSRLQYAELGAQLEAYWKIYPADNGNRDALLAQAAANYRLAGDAAAEMRVYAALNQAGALPASSVRRYAELLSARAPQTLLALAGPQEGAEVRDAAANYVLENGTAARALDMIAARGRGLPPVWTRAYTGLAGLYRASNSVTVSAAFRDALGTGTIGERLGAKVDRGAQLAGQVWFYYGTSFGEYLATAKQGGAEDYLPAILEGAPPHAENYFKLAEYYRESGQLAAALADYRNALQLDNARADVHDRLALIHWEQGRHEEAVREWAAALDAFARQQDQRRVPADFWEELPRTLRDIGQYKALDKVRAQADQVLRTYIRRNGSYQIDALLNGALASAGDSAAGVSWLVDLSRAAPDRAMFLASLAHSLSIPEAQRAPIWQALTDSAREKLAAASGEARGYAETELRNWQIERAEFLLGRKQPEQARLVLAELPEEARKTRESQIAPLEVRIAAQSGALAALLARYRREPDAAPALEALQRAANDLSASGDALAARQVLEFVYTRQLELRQLSAPAFLGLAEIRLAQGDAPKAATLLRRMTLVAGEPFETLSEAAALLNRTGHPAEAVEFLAQRAAAAPWDDAARAQLGETLVQAGKERERGLELLKSVAQSASARYDARASAARFLGASKAAALTTASAELNALSAGAVTPAAAAKPYFYYARIEAANGASGAATRIRLLREAIAISPDENHDKTLLFEAAFNAKRYATAIGALYPLLANSGLGSLVETDREAPGEDGLVGNFDGYAGQFLNGDRDRAARARIARQLGQAYLKENRPGAAAALFEISLQLDNQPGARADLERLRPAAERDKINGRRRPVVSEKLEQERLTLPRREVP